MATYIGFSTPKVKEREAKSDSHKESRKYRQAVFCKRKHVDVHTLRIAV